MNRGRATGLEWPSAEVNSLEILGNCSQFLESLPVETSHESPGSELRRLPQLNAITVDFVIHNWPVASMRENER